MIKMAEVTPIEEGSDEDVIDLNEINGPIYEQHPDETDRAYQVFMEWMHLGRDRTLKQAYMNIYDKTEEEVTNYSHIYDWKKEYRWEERVEAWDNEVEQGVRREYKKEAQEAARRYAKSTACVMEAMTQEIMERFGGSREKAKKQFEDMGTEDFVRTMQYIQSLENKALGGFLEDGEPDESYMELLAEASD